MKTLENIGIWAVALLIIVAICAAVAFVCTLLTMGAWNYGVRAIWAAKPLSFWPAFWLWMAIGIIGKAFQSVKSTE